MLKKNMRGTAFRTAIIYTLAFVITASPFSAYADTYVTAEAPMALESSDIVTVAESSPAETSSAESPYVLTAEPVSAAAPSVTTYEPVSQDAIDSVTGPGVAGGSVYGPSSSGTSSQGSVSSGTGRAGINHAADASLTVDLGFKIVSPRIQRGSTYVAEGSVQLSDGSWAALTHELNVNDPYYRVLREVTDSQGVDWYVCAAHATKIGDYYTADGSQATELWLKKSDCTEQTSITLNTTNQTRINLVKAAFENLGDDYTYGMTGPDEFDCSGFVNYVFSQAGISVPRQSTAICQMSGQISIEDLRPGDIVGRPGHVGVYVGGGIFIHSSETSTGVIAEYVDVYNSINGFTNYINAVGD